MPPKRLSKWCAAKRRSRQASAALMVKLNEAFHGQMRWLEVDKAA
jgi:hypothetical protein